MSVLRAVWWALAAVAVALTVWDGSSPISDVDMSCRKTGVLDLDGAPASAQCDDSIVHVVGVWPLVWLGLLVAIPPVVAALAMRRWVSWLAVAALAGLAFVGMGNWSTFWGLLLKAVPLTAIAVIVAIVQQTRHPAGTGSRMG
ncbi:ABC transporter permease [Aldersonia sp. NBC_00410]|uniref:ABC transporter permease n=1 Tax=Aldersonia sp. NBC_00410 TaxID=2975954 RepID=UPI00225A09AB|nr:ABC transporter permease [Aldersonia sp. NBC_00410]MCX5042417.1 ABC transporter permease [Aldersonia sp. NBC_00410]